MEELCMSLHDGSMPIEDSYIQRKCLGTGYAGFRAALHHQSIAKYPEQGKGSGF